MGNAEELASLVIIECADPGAPMIYASEVAPANMKTGEMNYGGPVYLLLSAAGAQMARFYKIPSLAADVSLEAAPSDLMSFERNVLKAAMHFMCKSDLSPSLGGCDVAMSASLDQLILDAEACEHARAYLRTSELNDDSLGFDIIHKVGPGGHFLGEKHTVEHFKKEIWSRELSDTFILDAAVKGQGQRSRRYFLHTYLRLSIRRCIGKWNKFSETLRRIYWEMVNGLTISTNVSRLNCG